MSRIVVQYIDKEGKSRWGYVTQEILKKLADRETHGGDGVTVFLADGRTGDAKIGDLSVVMPFAENPGCDSESK